MITFCPECRKEVEYQIKKTVEKKEVRGLEFEYNAERAFCYECGEEIFIPELHDNNLQKIDDAYRDKAGIIKVSGIKEIVEQYNTGKRQLSLLLGWGETTLTCYLNGDIFLKSYSETLRKVKDDYRYMKQLAEENRDKVTDKAFNDLIDAVKNLQKSELKTERKIDSAIIEFDLVDLQKLYLKLNILIFFLVKYYTNFEL
jgi:putative zinc finger/helix-turn-helix YgiT family protein